MDNLAEMEGYHVSSGRGARRRDVETVKRKRGGEERGERGQEDDLATAAFPRLLEIRLS